MMVGNEKCKECREKGKDRGWLVAVLLDASKTNGRVNLS